MPNPDTVFFCLAYSAWLGLLCVGTLECVRRSRYPIVVLLVGLGALAASFGFAIWLEGGLVKAGQEYYQLGLPFRNFRRIAFAVFLVLLAAGGPFLLARMHSGRSDSAA
jgi:hypothetical protein